MAVTVVLLAAGYATRLYPLTKDRPKTLLPLGHGTILDAVLKTVNSVKGITKTVLVTNHRFAAQFHAWHHSSGWNIHVLDDGTDTVETRLGAIRDLELARREVGPTDDLLVVGTDNVFQWPLGAFVEAAQQVRPNPSIALWQAPSKASASQFGVVIRDQTARITAFIEKSPQPPSAEVALCVYYFPSAMCGKITAFLASGGNADAPGYFIEWLVRHETVYGVMMPGPWYDIGTLEAYEAVKQEWP